MAKNNLEQEKHPFRMVIYIAAVIILLACILVMVFQTRRKQKDYENEIAQMSQSETEYVRPERTTEAESESEADTEPAPATEAKAEEDQTDADEASEAESQEESQPDSTESESSEEETEEESEEIQSDLRILVLNGTGVQGVAGYWEGQLEADGYEDVISASYEEEADDETVIYTQERSQALPLQDYFQESRISIVEITEGILMSEGEEEPEDVDVYIVVGKTDARSE